MALTSSSGDHIRWVPGALAAALVMGGQAEPDASNGKVRVVRLLHSAASQAQRIGEPEGRCLMGTRFTRWVRLDAVAARVLEFHPRSLYPDPE